MNRIPGLQVAHAVVALAFVASAEARLLSQEAPQEHPWPREDDMWSIGSHHHQDPFRNYPELKARCLDEKQKMPSVREFFVGNSDGIVPERRVLTKESSLEEVESGFRDHFDRIRPHLPESVEAVEAGWDTSSCAVVGSSGNLLHTQYGEDIDKHGMVFRLNRAPTWNVEKCVGKKTTVRVLNHNYSKNYATDGHANHGIMRHAPEEEAGPVLEPNVTLLMSRISTTDHLTMLFSNMTKMLSRKMRQVWDAPPSPSRLCSELHAPAERVGQEKAAAVEVL